MVNCTTSFSIYCYGNKGPCLKQFDIFSFSNENYKKHIESQHPVRIHKYSELLLEEKRKYFDEHSKRTFVKYFNIKEPIIYDVNLDIIHTIIFYLYLKSSEAILREKII